MKNSINKICSLSALVLAILLGANSVYSQDKNAPVNVKANLIVLDAEDKEVADIKQEYVKIFEDGTEQKITYFARKEPVLNLGIVVDNSGSLRMMFDEVIFMSSTIAENLRPDDEAFGVRFVGREQIEIVQDWTTDKTKLDSAFRQMYVAGGQTAMIDALYLSAQKLLEREKENNSKRYALILISDGVDRNSYYKLGELLALFENSDAQIFSISYPEEDALKQIKNLKKNPSVDMKTGKRIKENPILLNNILATETGGTAYTLSKNYDKAEIVSYLKAIISELRSNYIIGYTSTNQKRDGKVRNLRVEIADGEGGAKRCGFVREKFKVLNEKDITK